MSIPALRPDRVAVTAVYVIAGLLIFTQPMDLITNTWPLQVGNIQWRYGFIGLLAGFIQTPLLGILVGAALAFAMGHTAILKALSVAAVCFSAVIAVAVPTFALDVIQIRLSVPAEQLAPFQAGALISVLKHVSTGAAFVLLGIGGLRTVKGAAQEAEQGSPPLVRPKK